MSVVTGNPRFAARHGNDFPAPLLKQVSQHVAAGQTGGTCDKCSTLRLRHLSSLLYVAWSSPGSIGEAIAEHWQTALRLRASRLILEDVPVFGQHPVGDAHDVGGDPVSRQSGARESSVDDDKVAFSHDHARLIFEGRGRALDKVEET